MEAVRGRRLIAVWMVVRFCVMLGGILTLWAYGGVIADTIACSVDPSYQPDQVQVTMYQAERGVREASLALGNN